MNENSLLPKTYKYNLHLITSKQMPLPPSAKTGETHLTKADFLYFHYGCDGFNDSGWGCAYRTLQSMCSQILHIRGVQDEKNVPSLAEIQKALVYMGDKPSTFVHSTDFIGAIEIFATLDFLYKIESKIIHVQRISELHKHMDELKRHFRENGTLIMAGGDLDRMSKGIAGIHTNGAETYFLIVDPHYRGVPKSLQDLFDRGFIKWTHISEFADSSFYNFCLPQVACTRF